MEMSRKTFGWILIFAGLLLAVVSLVADSIGLGNEVGFGWKQIAGTVVGLASLAYGYWLGRARAKSKK
jgi:hypothetical protein